MIAMMTVVMVVVAKGVKSVSMNDCGTSNDGREQFGCY